MPTDSTNLLVLSALSGEITQTIPLAQLADMESLLGQLQAQLL
jgi:hypothetical protein